MFGSKKKKLTNVALDRLRPSFFTLTSPTGGPPAGVASDPYVVGYIFGTVGTFAQVLFHSNISNEDLGLAFVDVFSILFGVHPASQPEITSLTTGERKDPEFVRGAKTANKIVCTMMQLPNYETDPDVLAAKAELTSNPSLHKEIASNVPEHLKIAARLQANLVDKYLFERYVSG